MGYPGLKVQTNTQSLLSGNIAMCQEGMSPLMERFTKNKRQSQQQQETQGNNNY